MNVFFVIVKRNETGSPWSATLISLVVGTANHDVIIQSILPSHIHRLGSIDFVHLGEASTILQIGLLTISTNLVSEAKQGSTLKTL